MRFTLPLFALAALAAPSLAAAQQTVTVEIKTADLDLSTADGRKALDARIEAKLRKACELDAAPRYGYGKKIIDRACLSEARAEARAKAQQLTSNTSRSGREVAAN